MNWFITDHGAHWILCEIISVAFGVAVYRLHDDAQTRKGRARKGYIKDTWLVEAL